MHENLLKVQNSLSHGWKTGLYVDVWRTKIQTLYTTTEFYAYYL